MRASNNSKSKNSTDNHRSYFDWGRNMQVIRKGNGDIAMTESELVRFFDVSCRKLNYSLQTIIKSSNFHSNERGAGEEEIIKRGKTVSYLPLYPFLPSSPCPFYWTARKCIYSESISVRGCRNLHP